MTDQPKDEWARSTLESLERFMREEKEAQDPSHGSDLPAEGDAPFAGIGSTPFEPESPSIATPAPSAPVDSEPVQRIDDDPADNDDEETRAAQGEAQPDLSWMRLNLREILIVTLCVIGVAEVGWIGLKVLETPAGVPAQAGPKAATPTPQAATNPPPTPPVAKETTTVAPPQVVKPTQAPASPAPEGRPAPAAVTAPTAKSGWLTLSAPVPVDILERGRRVGSSRSGRVRLSAGHHELQIVNRTFGLDTRKTVEITADAPASLAIEVPPGFVNINALPWATVQIDGTAAGDTPLAYLQLPAGPHNVLFTHPELGEQRMKITVPSGKLLKVSTDLRGK